MTPDDYPEISALRKTLTGNNIRLAKAPEDERLRDHSYRRIQFSLLPESLMFSIPVDDEYGDANDDKQELLLHLVLAECEMYEESDDFLNWAREIGFNASETWVLDLYTELGELVPRIREIVGPDICAVSSYDFALNAGAAAALRRI